MRQPSVVMLAMLCVLIAGCASSSPGPTSTAPVDVTGTWQGTFRSPAGVVPVGSISLILQQTGTRVTGTASPGGDLEGVVDGNSFSYRFANLRGGGDVTVNGDEMTGYSGGGSRLDFKRVR
jgi:hypothetical protein